MHICSILRSLVKRQQLQHQGQYIARLLATIYIILLSANGLYAKPSIAPFEPNSRNIVRLNDGSLGTSGTGYYHPPVFADAAKSIPNLLQQQPQRLAQVPQVHQPSQYISTPSLAPQQAHTQQNLTFLPTSRAGIITKNNNNNHHNNSGLLPAVPNQRINHQQQQVQQQLLRRPYLKYEKHHQQQHHQQQTFANKLLVQQSQIPLHVIANKTITTTTLSPVLTTTSYKSSDIIANTLIACNGCDPRGWPLYKSLVSLQNPLLLGGDILVRTASSGRPLVAGYGRLYKVVQSRSAAVDPVSLWPNGVIYYELDESVAHLATLIWLVMQQFHVHTCIRFVPRQNNEPDFLRISALRGCSSYIGRIGGEQTLSLGDGCEYRGTIAHELLHAVGFYHHQNRSDRDDFLEILWENVAKGKEDQFRKMSADENYLLNEFDYNSIMLYGPHTFGKTLDKVTMKPKREGVILLELIEKRGLSPLDIDSVNKLYKCAATKFEMI